jgi:hypothetical protein
MNLPFNHILIIIPGRIGGLNISDNFQGESFGTTFMAQPSSKTPIISKKALKQGIIEDGKTIGIWFTDIGANLWEAALSMDSNSTIELEKFKGAVFWTIVIKTKFFSLRLTSKQYYVPIKSGIIDPVAIKIDITGASDTIDDYLRRFLGNYEKPPYDFRKPEKLEKSFKISLKPILESWDGYFKDRYEITSKPTVKEIDPTIDKKKNDKIGKWMTREGFLGLVADVFVISIIVLFYVLSPLIVYLYHGGFYKYYYHTLLLEYLMGTFFLVVMAIPFRNLAKKYKVGFHRRSYKDIDKEKVHQVIENILRKMKKPYTYKEKFLMSRIFREKCSLIDIPDLNLMILYEHINPNPKISFILVRIGKIDETNEAFALDLEKRLDEELVKYIR